jgi:ABC-2 type transport system ATP-binding protein
MMSNAPIRLDKVSKRFGTKAAVQDVSLEVPEGCVCGLVGPNGAGKTTIIRMILGLLPPSQGTLRTLGLDPTRQSLELRRRIGYVPESHHIYPWMKVQQVLRFVASVYPTWSAAVCQRTIKLLSLPMDRKVKQLSRGELAKLALTVALAHEPALLLLDEPTSGLDPLVRHDFLTAIIELIQSERSTVFFSTHILSDIERVADRVIVMNAGQVVANDTLDAIRGRYMKASMVFDQAPPPDTPIPGAVNVERGLREWVVIFERQSDAEVRSAAAKLGAKDCALQEVTFEEAFVQMLRPEETT